jgi:hypothetical protein
MGRRGILGGWMRLLGLLVIAASLGRPAGGIAAAEDRRDVPPPAYRSSRQDEDYRYLTDPGRRSAAVDDLKFIPLTQDRAWFVSLGGEARWRFEFVENANFGAGPQDGDGYLMQRYMLHMDVQAAQGFRLFGQFKSGLIDGRAGGARPVDRDDFDLHQAFIDWRHSWDPRRTITVRAGRQELAFGSSRLVSVRESPNVRQSFDGLRATAQWEAWRIDAFATRPATTRPGVFDDHPDPGAKFWGIYAVRALPWLKGASVDAYYLGLDRGNARFDQGTAHETRHSIGARLWGRRAALDWNFEFVGQFGTFGAGEIRAWTAASDTGWNLTSWPGKPRIAIRLNTASGDNDPTDPDLGTFNALFPRGAYFNELALIGPANFADVHPYLEVRPARNLRVTLEWNRFWRASGRDGLYNVALAPLRTGRIAGGRLVGDIVTAFAVWDFQRHWSLRADYARFLAGEFIEQTGASKDIDYVSVWLTFRF